MSILAKLLKKGNDHQESGEILPGLKQAVHSANQAPDKRRQRYLLTALAAVLLTAGGGLLLVYLQTRTPSTLLVKKEPLQQVAATTLVQHQPSSSKATTATSAVTATARAPETEKKVKSSARKISSTVSGSAIMKAPARPPEQKNLQDNRPPVKDRATIDAWLFAARTAEVRRDYNQAMTRYRMVLEVEPHNYRIMNNLASICLNLELYGEALSYANHALKLKPDYLSALVNGGIAQRRLGNEASALGMLSRALTVEPANRNALYNLALIQEQSNLPDEAFSTWRRLSDTGDANGLLGMARIKERSGEKGNAIRLYREVTTNTEAGQRLKETARERIAVLDR